MSEVNDADADGSGDDVTATARKAIKSASAEEARDRAADKAAKKAAFDSEYDVGEPLCKVKRWRIYKYRF